MEKNLNRFKVLVGKNESSKSRLLLNMIEPKLKNGNVYYYSSADRKAYLYSLDSVERHQEEIQGNNRYKEGFQMTCSDVKSTPFKICAIINKIATQCLSKDVLILDNIDVDLDLKTVEYIMSVLEDVHEDKTREIEIVLSTHNSEVILQCPNIATFYFIEVESRDNGLGSPMNKFSAYMKLVEGIPSKAIEFKVFSEAQNDRDFYIIIYGQLAQYGKVEKMVRLNFESSSREGSCDGGKSYVIGDVKQTVSNYDTLKEKETSSIDNPSFKKAFGIVDMDYDDNMLDCNRIVLTKRHSLENYVCDPIILCQILAHLSQHEAIKEEKKKKKEKVDRVSSIIKKLWEISINLKNSDSNDKRDYKLERLIVKEFKDRIFGKKDGDISKGLEGLNSGFKNNRISTINLANIILMEMTKYFKLAIDSNLENANKFSSLFNNDIDESTLLKESNDANPCIKSALDVFLQIINEFSNVLDKNELPIMIVTLGIDPSSVNTQVTIEDITGSVDVINITNEVDVINITNEVDVINITNEVDIDELFKKIIELKDIMEKDFDDENIAEKFIKHCKDSNHSVSMKFELRNNINCLISLYDVVKSLNSDCNNMKDYISQVIKTIKPLMEKFNLEFTLIEIYIAMKHSDKKRLGKRTKDYFNILLHSIMNKKIDDEVDVVFKENEESNKNTSNKKRNNNTSNKKSKNNTCNERNNAKVFYDIEIYERGCKKREDQSNEDMHMAHMKQNSEIIIDITKLQQHYKTNNIDECLSKVIYKEQEEYFLVPTSLKQFVNINMHKFIIKLMENPTRSNLNMDPLRHDFKRISNEYMSPKECKSIICYKNIQYSGDDIASTGFQKNYINTNALYPKLHYDKLLSLERLLYKKINIIDLKNTDNRSDNQNSLYYPNWFLYYHGHTLFAMIKSLIGIDDVKNILPILQKDIVKYSIQYLPSDMIQIIKDIESIAKADIDSLFNKGYDDSNTVTMHDKNDMAPSSNVQQEDMPEIDANANLPNGNVSQSSTH